MPKRKLNKYQVLVIKFIKDPSVLKPRDWAREVKIAKKLYEKFNDEKFWRHSFLNFKLNSLAWLLSKDGLTYLKEQRLILKLRLPEQKKIKLENKIYETKEKVDKPPRSVLDFLEGEK